MWTCVSKIDILEYHLMCIISVASERVRMIGEMSCYCFPTSWPNRWGLFILKFRTMYL